MTSNKGGGGCSTGCTCRRMLSCPANRVPEDQALLGCFKSILPFYTFLYRVRAIAKHFFLVSKETLFFLNASTLFLQTESSQRKTQQTNTKSESKGGSYLLTPSISPSDAKPKIVRRKHLHKIYPQTSRISQSGHKTQHSLYPFWDSCWTELCQKNISGQKKRKKKIRRVPT